MFKGLMGKRRTTKADVVMSVAMAIIGVWKASDTIKEFKADQADENKENK